MGKSGSASDNIVHLKAKAETSAKSATDFVRDHPLMVVAGGIAVGLIAGALLPRGTGRAIAKRASSLAEIGAAAAVTLGTQALEKADSAKSSGLELGRQALDRAETARSTGADIGRQAWERAEAAAGSIGKRGEAVASEALAAAGETGQRLVRKAAELAAKVRS